MKVLICGGRAYWRRDLIRRALQTLKPSLVIHGGAGSRIGAVVQGADLIAGAEAFKLGIEVVVVNADWDRYGKSAGPRRNQAMLDTYRPDVVVWFPGGRGTADMRQRAECAGVRLVDGEALAAGEVSA